MPRLRMHTIALVYLYALLMAVALGWDAAVSDAPATKGPGWVFTAALFVMVATAVSTAIGTPGLTKNAYKSVQILRGDRRRGQKKA